MLIPLLVFSGEFQNNLVLFVLRVMGACVPATDAVVRQGYSYVDVTSMGEFDSLAERIDGQPVTASEENDDDEATKLMAVCARCFISFS